MFFYDVQKLLLYLVGNVATEISCIMHNPWKFANLSAKLLHFQFLENFANKLLSVDLFLVISFREHSFCIARPLLCHPIQIVSISVYIHI